MTEVMINKNQDLLKQYDDQKRLYQSFVAEMEHQIKSILQANQITCNAIASRLKSRESLAEKIDRKQAKYKGISDITDIAGVRIITYYSEDVDRIAKIIENEFDVDYDNSIDKREAMEPDRFGYCSVHYVVKMSADRIRLCEYRAFEGMKCEIQIRSVLQHAWAEIEHDIGYKSETTLPKEMRRSFSRIAGLLEIADKEFNDIRKKLEEYREAANRRIKQEEFLDREIDAVLIDVIISTDKNYQLLNKHIATLMGGALDDSADDLFSEKSILELNWLGVRTVRQIISVITKYTERAMYIATENLKDYDQKTNDERIDPTIGFFYLAYAVLLSEQCTKEQINKYLAENHIGGRENIEEVVHYLYELGKSMKDG